jgi:hypothetical protein
MRLLGMSIVMFVFTCTDSLQENVFKSTARLLKFCNVYKSFIIDGMHDLTSFILQLDSVLF